ncbi:FeoA family protein [Caldisericum exile]|uniref:Ferrous iron transport protein A n=1 Tax=Caldisericum exile (strain DSM 21853 / NBRC 104410 / AZM16c01) TaxID=511051 RepID=A0A7U6JH71_CALEA|nr:FeoA family protein [Caldisericum exile]BAL81592.1 putative ferrous iron transport protein A [Caldisericum exile AZM16c01]
MRKTLAEVDGNKIVKVVDFVTTGHRSHVPQYIIRLQEMGILKGDVIKVNRNTFVGPVEVNVKGTNLAIGRGIASKIIVEEI